MKSIFTSAFLSLAVATSFAQSDNLEKSKTEINDEFHGIVKSMPSPLEELEALHGDKVKFNEHLLSSPAGLNTHQTDAAQAMNCGVYLVDFVYLSVYQQQDKMMEYRHLAHELAFRLDAAEPFAELLKIDLENKVKDYEGLKKKIIESLDATEDYLIKHNKLATASQMLLGSWMETQYITLQSFKTDKKKSEQVKTYIKDQQVHLANLIKLVHEFKDEAGLHNELEKLNQLEASFQKIHSLDEVNDAIIAELTDEITRLRMDILGME